ncbi:MAG: glycosyltransferase family 2 protein [Flavobacteriaceae bacterium]|nr:glycosyltransferase family 2 protein [Flavobacteriaceae bacterium]
MKIGIIIPAHNEAAFIKDTLDSLVSQTRLPDVLCVVDDNSTDETSDIIASYSHKHPWLLNIKTQSSDQHLPGAKVIRAWKHGLNFVSDCDVICKFDADLVFPPDYLMRMLERFKNQSNLGMFAGVLQVIDEDGAWIDESISNPNHIRGPIKAYRKKCLDQIGGLREALGWDTLDVLLSQYHGWETITDPNLKVKHLRPTGSGYTSPKHMEVFYALRYGYLLSMLATFKQQSFNVRTLCRAHRTYFKAKSNNLYFLVNKKEGIFIRRLRWRGVWKRLFSGR